MSATLTAVAALDTLETIDESLAPAAPTPRVDLLTKWFDESLPLAERKAARQLFFGSACERGTHRMGGPIRPSRFATRDNPMVGEPTYYRIDQPRRACDIHGSGKIYEYTSRKEEFEFAGEVRTGYVVDVYDLGLNASGERALIGVVRRDGQPFLNEQDAYAATLGPNNSGWLQRRWEFEAEQFRTSEAGRAQLAKIDAAFIARDQRDREQVAAWAKHVNELAALGNQAKADGNMEAFAAYRAKHAEAKATWAELKAAYERRPVERDAESTAF